MRASIRVVRIDLHAHTTASDGTDDPGALAAVAAAAGLDVVAITDHDTVAGWEQATTAVRGSGVTLVRGAELSCRAGEVPLHLLAYLFDPRDQTIIEEMALTRDDRIPRAQEIVRRLAADGWPVTWEEVLAQAGDAATIARPHIADVLVGNGAVGDRREAFDRLLKDGSPYFVGHHAPDAVAAVGMVRAAGGVAVFAHPGASRRGLTVGDDVIDAMAEAGLAALEVEHRDHDQATRDRLRALAKSLGLMVTGSSDYHGDGKDNRLGEHLTDPETYQRLVSQATGVQLVSA